MRKITKAECQKTSRFWGACEVAEGQNLRIRLPWYIHPYKMSSTLAACFKLTRICKGYFECITFGLIVYLSEYLFSSTLSLEKLTWSSWRRVCKWLEVLCASALIENGVEAPLEMEIRWAVCRGGFGVPFSA